MFLSIVLLIALLSIYHVVAEENPSLAARVRYKAPEWKAKAVMNDEFIDIKVGQDAMYCSVCLV